MLAVAFEYQILSEAIHLLRFHRMDAEALDQCFAQLRVIFRTAPPDQPLLLLTDITIREMPPIMELYQHSRHLLAAYPTRPPLRNAVLYWGDEPSIYSFAGLMNMLAGFFGAKARIFGHEERSTALDWLLEGYYHLDHM